MLSAKRSRQVGDCIVDHDQMKAIQELSRERAPRSVESSEDLGSRDC